LIISQSAVEAPCSDPQLDGNWNSLAVEEADSHNPPWNYKPGHSSRPFFLSGFFFFLIVQGNICSRIWVIP
jgi:hypothetical protein